MATATPGPATSFDTQCEGTRKKRKHEYEKATFDRTLPKEERLFTTTDFHNNSDDA